MNDTDTYKNLAAKYLKEKDHFEELHRIARKEADGYWDCLKNREKEVGNLQQQRNDLLAACEKANTEIIAATEIPTDKRLEKDKDNSIYVIRDMLAIASTGQQILKQAIAKAKK